MTASDFADDVEDVFEPEEAVQDQERQMSKPTSMSLDSGAAISA